MSHVRHIESEAAAARALLAALQETIEDASDVAATIVEGETDLMEALNAGVTRLQNIETLAAAIRQRIKQMKARDDRLEAQAETIRTTIKRAMEQTGMGRCELPAATLSVRDKPRAVEVLDMDALPIDWKRVKYEPDRIAIGKALREGRTVPGAQLSAPATSLHVSEA